MHFIYKFVLFILIITSNVNGQQRLSKVKSTEYAHQVLSAINSRRAAHCAPPLGLNSQLNRIAQEQAEYLCYINKMVISSNTFHGEPLGENLYTYYGSYPVDSYSQNGADAVKQWYRGKASYNYEYPSFSTTTGSFTQLVWISSKILGVGHCCTSNGHNCYVVANFHPAGNYQGQYTFNVKSESCGRPPSRPQSRPPSRPQSECYYE